MSNATTNQQALAEFVNDLKRLNTKEDGTPDRDKFLAAVDWSAVQLQQRSQTTKEEVGNAMAGFIAKNKAAVDLHVDGEIAAKEALRSAFDVKADAKADAAKK